MGDAVAFARRQFRCCELDGPDFQFFLIDPGVDFAPYKEFRAVPLALIPVLSTAKQVI